MTRYEQGFMNKCAEYGVDGKFVLEKLARIIGGPPPPPGMLGASSSTVGGPASIPKNISKKHSIKDAITGIYDAMPSNYMTIGSTGPRIMSNGELRKMQEGLTLFQRLMVSLNPNLAKHYRRKNGLNIDLLGRPRHPLMR